MAHKISTMASELERARQRANGRFHCLWPVLDMEMKGFDGCKNITMIFFRVRILADAAQAH
jgi:hypothetical protein